MLIFDVVCGFFMRQDINDGSTSINRVFEA
jgi:hypothetical protein